MAKSKRVGKLPPCYSFILNQYPYERLSKCPKCKKQTHERKFALFIHIDGWGPLVFGKTCKYCTPCELIMVHQTELELELTQAFERLDLKLIGNDYFVLGSVDKKVWQKGLEGSNPMGEILENMADIKEYLELHVDPGGWLPE